MSEPFVAEIRIVGFNFAPTGWAQCNGQLMPISQNTALFSLLGTYYGGDGKSTFALPNLVGSTAMFWGQGSGLSEHFLGESGGSETVTLDVSEMPNHTHSVMAVNDLGNVNGPSPLVAMGRSTNANAYLNTNQNVVQMNIQEIGIAGSSLPHNNMQPYLTMNYIIAMQGVFPPRQ
ncbi:MAG TPA: tail fiber protein [Pyrinomonadaceae bacterium]|jgi:microcystin-dependent protein